MQRDLEKLYKNYIIVVNLDDIQFLNKNYPVSEVI